MYEFIHSWRDIFKKDIYEILKVPKEKQGGAWNTGYTRYNNDYYIFVNIGVPGRTGHDYPNEIIDGSLNWYGKNKSHINQNTIRNMISEKFNLKYLFFIDIIVVISLSTWVREYLKM